MITTPSYETKLVNILFSTIQPVFVFKFRCCLPV